MSEATDSLPQDIEAMIAEENKMMWVMIAFFTGVVAGIAIGYLIFVRYEWHF